VRDPAPPGRGRLARLMAQPNRQPGAARDRGQVAPRLWLGAGYAGRLIVIFVLVYLVFAALARLSLAVFAVFGALVLTALLRPVVDLLDRLVPRPMAVALGLFGGFALVAGVLVFIGVSIAGQSADLAVQFQQGVGRITHWLADSPAHIRPETVNTGVDQARQWLVNHRGALAGQVLGGASTAAEVFTGVILAVFCGVFFLSGGRGIWAWFLDQVPAVNRERVDAAGRAAWSTFEGYARATVIVAASNAAIVAVALLALRVPLAVPLALLVFLASFIPLVGGAFSLAIATVVALAARGPAIALVVLALIVVVGQLEGHVFQPLIMSRSVRLHPVVVILAVTCGSVLGGLPGALVSVPVVAVGWSVFSALRRR